MIDDRRQETAPVPPLRPVPPAEPGGARIVPPPPVHQTVRPEPSLWPPAWLILLVFLVVATLYAAIF